MRLGIQASKLVLLVLVLAGVNAARSAAARLTNYLIPHFLMRLLHQRFAQTPRPRPRLISTEKPSVIYAIGDVHGCMAELTALELQIVEDAAPFTGEKWIVMLGDYVDRGPYSADVLDHLTASAPIGFKRICLVGNHETMMLKFLDDPALDCEWLQFGGEATLTSYGIDVMNFRRSPSATRRAILKSYIPSEHIEFMTQMPVLLALPGLNFVHAGLRPGLPLEQQVEQDLLWIREPFLSQSSSLVGRTIHGHTPVLEPVVIDNRVGIDTGAYASGILTAARVPRDGELSFLATKGHGGAT